MSSLPLDAAALRRVAATAKTSISLPLIGALWLAVLELLAASPAEVL